MSLLLTYPISTAHCRKTLFYPFLHQENCHYKPDIHSVNYNILWTTNRPRIQSPHQSNQHSSQDVVWLTVSSLFYYDNLTLYTDTATIPGTDPGCVGGQQNGQLQYTTPCQYVPTEIILDLPLIWWLQWACWAEKKINNIYKIWSIEMTQSRIRTQIFIQFLHSEKRFFLQWRIYG